MTHLLEYDTESELWFVYDTSTGQDYLGGHGMTLVQALLVWFKLNTIATIAKAEGKWKQVRVK